MNFIHINTVGNFNTARFSAVPTNDSYFTGADPSSIVEGTPSILYDDMVFCKEVKLIYTHGAFYKASETDLTNYYTKSQVDSAFATKNELSTKQNQITGNLGDVVYHNGTNVFTQRVLDEGYVVNTTADLNKCKNDTTAPEIVLNTWKRFSILNGVSNAKPAEIEAWTFNNSTFLQPLDTESFVGLVSDKSYSNYEVIVKCFSTGSDDATIGIVAAYAVDSSGKEHTLSFLRTPGGSSSTSKPRWAAVLDFNGSFESVAYNQEILADNSASTTIPSSTTNWNDASIENGTTIKIIRTGNVFTATCSQFGSNSIDNSTIITLDLETASIQNPLSRLFKGSAPWGYACFSQPSSKFTTILMTDPNHYIYDLTTNSVLEFSMASEAWVAVQDKTPMGEIGVGRFSFNRATDKLFYHNGSEIIEISRSLDADTVVSEVEVNGSSVVNNGVASITIPAQVQADWNENVPTSKAYIQNKPSIPAAQIQANWNETDTTSKAYIQNKPSIPAEQAQSNWNESDTSSKAYILNKPSIPAEQIQSDWNEADITSKAFIQNKPSIPAEQVQANWNEANTTSKAYIQNKPVIPAAQVQSDWNEQNTSSKAYIQNKPTIPEQVQSDWNETNTTSKAFIQNKPTIPEQVQANWNEVNTSSKAYIQNKPTIPAAQVQSNWAETDTTSKAFIQNKPTIPEQVQANWNEDDTTSKAFIRNKPSIPAATTVTQVLTSGTEIARVNGTSIYSTTVVPGLKQISNLDSYLNSAPSGEIVQYIGNTTSNYTHGYIYKKVGTSYTLPANVKRFQVNAATTTYGETVDTTGWYIPSTETYKRSEVMAGGSRIWGYPLTLNDSQVYNGSYIGTVNSSDISSYGSYINSHWTDIHIWENVLTGVKITTWYNYYNYVSDSDITSSSPDSSAVIGDNGKLIGISRITSGHLTVNPTNELVVYGPQSWVRIDVQPQTIVPIHFVSADSITHDMSNISTSGYQINDLVVVTDLSSTLYYSFYYNSSLVSGTVSGVPYADVMFRYTGSGFKPISSPAIIV